MNWRIFRQRDFLFTTLQWNSLLFLSPTTRPLESNDVRSFSRKPFSCSAFGKLQAMSEAVTQPKNVEQIWSQYASEVLNQVESRDFGRVEQLWVSVYSRQEESFCRHALSPESGGKLLASSYFISNVRKTQNLWDNLSFRRRIVENAWCWSWRLLRFRLMYGKRSDARTRSQVHPKMEWLSPATQGICKENWWRKGSVRIPHISWQKDARDRERTVEWIWRGQGEDGETFLQKPLFIVFDSWEWWTKFGFLQRNRKEVR